MSFLSFVIEKYFKIKGFKKSFLKKPKDDFMDYIKDSNRDTKRKIDPDDVKIKSSLKEIYIENMQTFIINEKNNIDQKVILYLHGGAYLSDPVIFHYRACDKLARSLNAKVIFPIYPKASLHTYDETYRLLDILYEKILENNKDISIIGDSAGGGLALGFAMFLRDEEKSLPKDLILYSPWLDLNCDNPKIKDYEELDPMLSAWGLEKIGRMWAGCDPFSGKCVNINHPYLSPINGDFTNLSKISIFVGTHEIFLPDCMKLHEILNKKGIDHNFFVKEKMNHVYPIYPMKEGHEALSKTAKIIDNL